jgi:peptide chain release factor 3
MWKAFRRGAHQTDRGVRAGVGGRHDVGIQDEIGKRRTFAIISHPDAGKTTLTEKFLLYGGAVQLAGSVTARKTQRSTTSDWMELERKRGISVSSTVLQFDYADCTVNLLDTPGHKDFSEDTYRVLTAVDSALMVIDAAKGIESQTRKLFEVCRNRSIPIFAFMNKMDRPTLEPLALLDEIERTLQVHVFPVNWPLGTGFDFRGVFDRTTKNVHLFERLAGGGAYRAPVSIGTIADPVVRERLDAASFAKVGEELEILEAAGAEFDSGGVVSGGTIPVFFGSALNNFGVQLLLDAFLKHSAPPAPRMSEGRLIPTDHDAFSGFIFKIQANMDPNHRDRIAFVRVCSGKFTREMAVRHSRTGKTVRLNSSHKLFGRDRETVDEAYAGDIIGIVGHSEFGVGDTLTEEEGIHYDEIPHFTPEAFLYLSNPNPYKGKRFREGLDQLLQEGVIQELILDSSTQNTRLLAAVGPLQFDVVRFRLESEYGAETRAEPAPWRILRWLAPAVTDDQFRGMNLPMGCQPARTKEGQRVVMFPTDWALQYFVEKNPSLDISTQPYTSRSVRAASR